MDFCSSQLGRRAAAWVSNEGGDRLSLEAESGLNPDQRASLEQVDLPASEAVENGTASAVARAFGSPDVTLVRAADIVLAVEGPLPAASLSALRALVANALANARAVAAAEARNRHLDLALACTAHELSAPALAAKAALELRLTGQGDDSLLAAARDHLDGFAQQCDDLLRWASGTRPRLEMLDLGALVHDVVAATTARTASPRDANVTVDAGSRTSVWGDHSLLRAAVSNLVRNALVHAGDGDGVHVSVGAHNGHVRVVVADDGPGVTELERDSIFDPFVRGESGRSVRAGHGLGLFVARRIAEAHGGRLWAETRRRGASFVMALPRVAR